MPDTAPTKFFYTLSEAGELLSMSRSSLYREARLGRLRFRKLAGRTVIARDDILDFVNNAPLAPIRLAEQAAA